MNYSNNADNVTASQNAYGASGAGASKNMNTSNQSNPRQISQNSATRPAQNAVDGTDNITDERLEEIKIQHYNRKMMGLTNSPGNGTEGAGKNNSPIKKSENPATPSKNIQMKRSSI